MSLALCGSSNLEILDMPQTAEVSGNPTLAILPLYLVYDGSCGFCAVSVQFILRHERRHDLLFVPRDSESAAEDLRKHFQLEAVESMLWIAGNRSRNRVGRSAECGKISRRNLGDTGRRWFAGSGFPAKSRVSLHRPQSQAVVLIRPSVSPSHS